MDTVKVPYSHEATKRICAALGLEAEKYARVIIDFNVNNPIVWAYAQAIVDDKALDAICDVFVPHDLGESDSE